MAIGRDALWVDAVHHVREVLVLYNGSQVDCRTLRDVDLVVYFLDSVEHVKVISMTQQN